MNGTHTYLNNITGNLRIQNNGTVKSAQFEVDQVDFNDSANTGVRVRINGDGLSLLQDNDKIQLGASQDLTIFHDSSANNNVISGHLNSLNLRNYDTNSTDIILSARNDILLQTAINESAVFCDANAGVHLYYDGSQKFVTTSTGVQVGGNSTNLIIQEGTVSATAGGMITFKNTDGNGIQRDVVRIKGFTGNSTGGYGELTLQTAFANTLNDCLIIRKDKNVELPNDNQLLKIGAGQDLQLLHDGSRSSINNRTGELRVLANNNIRLGYASASNTTSATENYAIFNYNGSNELYYDNSKKLETISSGVQINGDLLSSANVKVYDNYSLLAGSGNDLQILHNGSSSVIRDNGSGALTIQNANSEVNIYNTTDNEYLAAFTNGGSVDLIITAVNSLKLQQMV